MKHLIMLLALITLYQWNVKAGDISENYVIAAHDKQTSIERAVELFKGQHPHFKGEVSVYANAA